jgi:hypothetical protein
MLELGPDVLMYCGAILRRDRTWDVIEPGTTNTNKRRATGAGLGVQLDIVLKRNKDRLLYCTRVSSDRTIAFRLEEIDREHASGV